MGNGVEIGVVYIILVYIVRNWLIYVKVSNVEVLEMELNLCGKDDL